eukprot:m.497666 g.497666  ORF g.497666 m.497666 type:complete len:672 (+) comp51966_c0_seq1:263-2278(+)
MAQKDFFPDEFLDGFGQFSEKYTELQQGIGFDLSDPETGSFFPRPVNALRLGWLYFNGDRSTQGTFDKFRGWCRGFVRKAHRNLKQLQNLQPANVAADVQVSLCNMLWPVLVFDAVHAASARRHTCPWFTCDSWAQVVMMHFEAQDMAAIELLESLVQAQEGDIEDGGEVALGERDVTEVLDSVIRDLSNTQSAFPKAQRREAVALFDRFATTTGGWARFTPEDPGRLTIRGMQHVQAGNTGDTLPVKAAVSPGKVSPSSGKVSPILPARPIKNRVFFGVGCGRYSALNSPVVPLCNISGDKDAGKVADLFKRRGFSPVKLHQNLNKAQLLRHFEDFCNKVVQKDDLVVVYVAAHGALLNGFPHIIPCPTKEVLTEITSQTLQDLGINTWDMLEQVASHEPLQVVFILDCCLPVVSLADAQTELSAQCQRVEQLSGGGSTATWAGLALPEPGPTPLPAPSRRTRKLPAPPTPSKASPHDTRKTTSPRQTVHAGGHAKAVSDPGLAFGNPGTPQTANPMGATGLATAAASEPAAAAVSAVSTEFVVEVVSSSEPGASAVTGGEVRSRAHLRHQATSFDFGETEYQFLHAVSPSQNAVDDAEEKVGVFTEVLIRHLEKTKAKEPLSNVFMKVTQAVKADPRSKFQTEPPQQMMPSELSAKSSNIFLFADNPEG